MEVDQDVGVVAVDLLKGEFRISGPKVESLAQFQSDPACVQTAGLFGSQTATETGERSLCKKSINRLIDDMKDGDINREHLLSVRQDDSR